MALFLLSDPAQELREPPEQDHHLLHGAGLVELQAAASHRGPVRYLPVVRVFNCQ